MNKRKIILISITVIFLVNCTLLTTESLFTTEINTNEVKILVLMDNNFGANYIGILSQFEKFGWDVTVAGPTETISGCEYNSVNYDVDILFSEITNIASYHCVNIMPGSSHVNLMADVGSILSKISSASSAGLIISAWCKAVRVLAAADVIDGEDVTGDSEFAVECMAAGATFHENSPPIISGNIVTVSSTQLYLNEMYLAMSQAIGCYETTDPVIENLLIIPNENGSTLLQVTVTDESGISEVIAILDLISSKDESAPAIITLELEKIGTSNNFSIIISSEVLGKYSITIEATDVFWNEASIQQVTTVEFGKKAGIEIISLLNSIVIFMSIKIIQRNKKNNR
ncbi:MAG: DJ-1/PfpI family protein [Candidatus Thorarchaeota archaeon]